MQYQEPGGKPGCDYLGLNYYSRGVVDWKLSATCNAGETMTDMPYVSARWHAPHTTRLANAAPQS